MSKFTTDNMGNPSTQGLGSVTSLPVSLYLPGTDLTQRAEKAIREINARIMRKQVVVKTIKRRKRKCREHQPC